MTHSSLAAVSRIRKHYRAAKRAALAGERLTSEQVKLVVKEYDALTVTIDELTNKTSDAAKRTEGASDDRVYAAAGKQIDEINRRADDVTARARALKAHPQIRATLLARLKSEGVS